MKYLAMAFLMSLQAVDAELARIEEWAKTQPDNGPGKIGIGDEYYKATKKFPKDKAKFMDKANEAWAKGWPDLDVFWKDKTSVNLKKIYAGAGGSKPLPKGWSAWQTFRGSISGEMAHSGGYALRIEPNKNTGLSQCFNCTPVAVQPGKPFVFSYWALSDGTNLPNIGFAACWRDATNQATGTTETGFVANCPVWTHVTVSGTVPEKTVAVHVNCICALQQGFMMFDDISLLVDGKEMIQNGGFEK